MTIDRLYGDNPLSQQPLWMIKTFYERGQRPVPQEIDSTLQELGPKPPTSWELQEQTAPKTKVK